MYVQVCRIKDRIQVYIEHAQEKGSRGDKAEEAQRLNLKSLYHQSLVFQRLWPELTKREASSTNVTIMTVGAIVLLPKICRHYPLHQRPWIGYYPVCNKVRQLSQKASNKFQRIFQAFQRSCQRIYFILPINRSIRSKKNNQDYQTLKGYYSINLQRFL
jgi:hypothetical protein